MNANIEGSDDLRDVSEEDLLNNACLLSQTNDIGAIQNRYESAANANEIPLNEYRKLVRQLNNKQRESYVSLQLV